MKQNVVDNNRNVKIRVVTTAVRATSAHVFRVNPPPCDAIICVVPKLDRCPNMEGSNRHRGVRRVLVLSGFLSKLDRTS